MVAEVEVVLDVNDVRRALRVPLAQVLQDLDLHQRLVVEPLLVADDLDGEQRVFLVVEHLHDLAE